MDCCYLFIQKYVSTQRGGDSEETLMPMVRKYLCYINAAWSLYNFEQTNVNANTTNKSIIEIAREMVVAERYPKVQLLRLGLSVADAFYGHVTQLLDIGSQRSLARLTSRRILKQKQESLLKLAIYFC